MSNTAPHYYPKYEIENKLWDYPFDTYTLYTYPHKNIFKNIYKKHASVEEDPCMWMSCCVGVVTARAWLVGELLG